MLYVTTYRKESSQLIYDAGIIIHCFMVIQTIMKNHDFSFIMEAEQIEGKSPVLVGQIHASSLAIPI